MRRGKKIRFICGSLILMAALFMGGCGEKKQADDEASVTVETVVGAKETASPTVTPVPTAEPTPAPTATPSPSKEPWTYTPPEIKKPIELSGNPEDEYVLEQPEYVETDKFIIFMDTGTKVYGNTVELIKTIFELVEKETGLSLDAKAAYDFIPNGGPKRQLLTAAFDGVDPNCEKYHIYVVTLKKSTPNGGYGFLTINPANLEIASGGGHVLVHEYTHSLQVANGPWMNNILDEGFATYITGQITKRDEIINFDFDADFNYSYYPTEITRENAEQLFLEEPEDGWDNYLYGYRFMHFLMENYGEDIYRKILAEALVILPEGENQISREESAVCVKKLTSPKVFEEFADWMKVNKERFEEE